MTRITLLLVMILMLSACAGLQELRDRVRPPDGMQPLTGKHTQVQLWLDDMLALRQQTPEMQRDLLQSRERRLEARPDNQHRMDVVLLLLVADEDMRDDRKARKLLREYEPLPPAGEDREFIRMLKQFLDTRELDAHKIAVLWKQVTEQNGRIRELEKQLRALTSIEQNIQQREVPAGETR